MIDWNIQSRARACQACEKHFIDKESYHTVLHDRKHAYERRDVCEACWTNRCNGAAPHESSFVSHWVGIYNAPPAAAPEAIGRETAESLLRKLVEQNDPSHAGARYILAAMLERKRLLKVKAQLNENGRRIAVYEHPASGDLFQIIDPDLQLNQLEAVQRDVADLLEHGLQTTLSNSSPPSAPPEAVPGADPGAVETQTGGLAPAELASATSTAS